ncbi:LOW QUALITY PROTEIN: cytochrome P450 [Colletotrichum tofieldiae]|nr:LOW QUALITY PROTEIN: cytochrome P450 [Colletotrichum tofieldiae]
MWRCHEKYGESHFSRRAEKPKVLELCQCLHQMVGDYVRYAPNRLLINTDTGMKGLEQVERPSCFFRLRLKYAIYGFSKKLQKSASYNIMVHRAPSTLTMTCKKKHALHRRIVSQGFANTALRQHEDTIMTHIKKLAAQLAPSQSNGSSEWSAQQNMSSWCKNNSSISNLDCGLS